MPTSIADLRSTRSRDTRKNQGQAKYRITRIIGLIVLLNDIFLEIAVLGQGISRYLENFGNVFTIG